MNKVIVIYYICFLIIATILIYTYVDLFYNTISYTIDMPDNLREIYKKTVVFIGHLIVIIAFAIVTAITLSTYQH